MAIGFLGLGAMGRAMAANLLGGGHALRVWNRDAAKADAFAHDHAQATAVSTPAQAAHGQVLFSMLADDAAARQVLIDGGVIDALPAGSVHINMATISVALARELTVLHAERGVAYLAVPVLGRPDVAARGQLNLLAGGDALALARVQPLLDLLGQRTWHLGAEPAQANAAKLAANLCIASAIGTMAEGAALRAELDAAIASGEGDCDWAVLAEVAARRAGQG